MFLKESPNFFGHKLNTKIFTDEIIKCPEFTLK